MKYALVTSSTNGIGKSIGIELLKNGYYVFFNGKENIVFEDDIGYPDNMYSIIKADLSKMMNMCGLVNRIKSKTDYLNCVVLNTGITCYDNFENITYANWQNVINTNLTIPFFLLQNLGSMMRNNGRIVFISSILGLIPHATSITYSVSKAALIMLSKSLVKVFKDRNITVNTIAPGFINTNWHNKKNHDCIEKIKSKISLSRFGEPEEIASVCMELINNGYINGSVIQIDGGYDFE